MPTIGPQLPPADSKRKRVDDETSNDRDSDDDIGPQLPSTHSDDTATAKKPKVVMGSLLPPRGIKPQPEPKPSTSDNESSDEDDYGPSLPSAADDPRLQANRSVPTAAVAQSTVSGASKRDEWMTMAPKSGDWSQRVDPTKLKNRKFNTSSGTASTSSDAWHETPEQKQARLQREVLGIKSDKAPSATTNTPPADAGQEETERRLKEYNAQRGPSLYQAHQQGKKDEEDDPSARAFDREKDIGGGLQLNASKRNDMVKNSSNFSSRFSTAKYL